MFKEIAEELMRAGAREDLLAMTPAYVYHVRKESDIYVDGCINDLLDFL